MKQTYRTNSTYSLLLGKYLPSTLLLFTRILFGWGVRKAALSLDVLANDISSRECSHNSNTNTKALYYTISKGKDVTHTGTVLTFRRYSRNGNEVLIVKD